MLKLLNIVVACAENRVIGRAGKLPWRIPEDFQRFEKSTAGGVCVLGRICFDTWPSAVNQQRQPVVVTHHALAADSDIAASRVAARTEGRSIPIAVASFPAALALAETLPGDVFVCGGQRIFEETLALVRPMRLHLTLVHAEVPGDRYFPEWRNLKWREIDRRPSRDANFQYTFFTLERVL